MYVNTAEEFFYITRSTSRSISTLLCVLIQQRSSSTRQGAPVGVYLLCCVCKYCRGAPLHDKEYQYENNLSVLCSSTAEELYHTTRSTSRSITGLLCVVVLHRSPSIRQGALVGIYFSCCVWQHSLGALLYDMEPHRCISVVGGSTAEFYHMTWSTIANLLRDYKHLLRKKRQAMIILLCR